MKAFALQFLTVQMRAMRCHAELITGAYKQANISLPIPETEDPEDGTMKYRPATDEEKLTSKLREMNSHIKFMQEIEDFAFQKENNETQGI